MTALFSPCRTWRYTLTREIVTFVAERKLTDLSVPEGVLGRVRARGRIERSGRGTVAFIGLNPSTADETQDDPTVRRCIGFARRWGYDRLVVLNAFAYRATNPAKLGGLDFSTAVGPENGAHLMRETRAADLVVCAWGVHAARWQRGHALRLALSSDGIELHHLGLTKDGHPKHPLYLRGDLEPAPWVW